MLTKLERLIKDYVKPMKGHARSKFEIAKFAAANRYECKVSPVLHVIV